MWFSLSLLSFSSFAPTKILSNKLLPIKLIKKSADYPPLSDNLLQIIVGLTMGDAHIYRNKTENASIHIEQSLHKEDYTNHLYDLLKDYCKSKPVIRSRTIKKTGNTHQSIRFTTRQLVCFTELHNMFYDKGIKIVPSNIEQLLTPVGLAYWAMDDGNKTGSGFHLNTHSFTFQEVEFLSNILRSKFNLINSIQSHKNGYRLYIYSKSMESFRDLVKPYFHITMMYKLQSSADRQT